MNDFILLNERYNFKFNLMIDKKNYRNLAALLKQTVNTNNIVIKGLLNAASTEFALKKISENQSVNNSVKKAISDAALKNGIIIHVSSLKIQIMPNNIYNFEIIFIIDNFSNVLDGIKTFVPKMTDDPDYRKIICNFIEELKFSIPDTCKAEFIEHIVNYSKKEICHIIAKQTSKKGQSVQIKDIDLKVEGIKK